MGSTNAGYLGSIGRGGTSNQTNASFQIGRAQRSIRRQSSQDLMRTNFSDYFQRQSFLKREGGRQRSSSALMNWEDTPYGPALKREAAVSQLGGNRLMGNRAQPTLLDRATLRGPSSNMTAEQARTGGDQYIQMRFNEPGYRSR